MSVKAPVFGSWKATMITVTTGIIRKAIRNMPMAKAIAVTPQLLRGKNSKRLLK
jgi:hypothetical protein